MRVLINILRGFFLAVLISTPAWSWADDKIPELVIKDHKYFPETLEVKANERFKVKVTNMDSTSEEFESRSLIIEKFIGPKRSIVVTLGPLKPGTYDFFGCFHPQTAKGKIIAK